jgi:hypothetical protein
MEVAVEEPGNHGGFGPFRGERMRGLPPAGRRAEDASPGQRAGDLERVSFGDPGGERVLVGHVASEDTPGIGGEQAGGQRPGRCRSEFVPVSLRAVRWATALIARTETRPTLAAAFARRPTSLRTTAEAIGTLQNRARTACPGPATRSAPRAHRLHLLKHLREFGPIELAVAVGIEPHRMLDHPLG